MRRKDKEITDKKIIEEILSKSEICRIAMVDNGQPYLIPVNYGYSDNAIYIHSASKGRKIEVLKQNNRVCFEMDYGHEVLKDALACNWTAKYRSLIGFGTVDILTDEEEKLFGLDQIMAHYGGPENNIYKKQNVNNIVILRINIEEVSMKQSGNWDQH
ncbi:MAG: pyridoxamine 5'-phosphate oxidase family protein [Bacteroidales bacterium]|nr:pyridoxamine 5'-phosphate oxidase family protein [Bacteroidales bacterium]